MKVESGETTNKYLLLLINITNILFVMMIVKNKEYKMKMMKRKEKRREVASKKQTFAIQAEVTKAPQSS